MLLSVWVLLNLWKQSLWINVPVNNFQTCWHRATLHLSRTQLRWLSLENQHAIGNISIKHDFHASTFSLPRLQNFSSIVENIEHNENMPMQNTEKFVLVVKMKIFSGHILIFFLFLLKTDCGYSLELPR